MRISYMGSLVNVMNGGSGRVLRICLFLFWCSMKAKSLPSISMFPAYCVSKLIINSFNMVVYTVIRVFSANI